jgi:Lrp/AsnC family transcriptional regulator for asnA, asnC and gidA
LFGIDAPPLRNASTVGNLADQIHNTVATLRPAVLALTKALPGFQNRFSVEDLASARLKTLRSLVSLLEALVNATHADVISDLLLEVVCEDDDHLLSLLNDKIRAIPGVRATETFTYLRLYKQTYAWGTR